MAACARPAYHRPTHACLSPPSESACLARNSREMGAGQPTLSMVSLNTIYTGFAVRTGTYKGPDKGRPF